ncbi:MAG: hypothetical protein CMK07_09810 [Ponticaulis sp.]|nr:hypothetical protein [Ponticaulis sp.]
MNTLLKAGTLAAATISLAFNNTSVAQDTPVATDHTWTDITYAKPDGLELLARIYRPEVTTGTLPVVISVHGGAWGAYDRTSGKLYDEALAEEGYLVVAIDFRQSPDYQHPDGSADVTAAVRWVRLNADSLGANPDQIGLIGSSSGGHLALLAAVRPNDQSHLGTPIRGESDDFTAHDEIDASVDYVVAMWPVSSPITRYRYAQRAGIDQLVSLTERYFSDENAMWDASIPRIVTAGEAGDLPPILVIQPGMDSNIPQDMTFDLLKAWQSRGGKVDYAFYPGAAHAFGHRPSEDTDDMLKAITAFIARVSD